MNYTVTSLGPVEVHVVSGGGSGGSLGMPITIKTGSTGGSGGSGGSAGMTVARISLEQCKWQKDLNQLSVPWNSNFPAEVSIHNHKTSNHRKYVRLTDTDPRFDQDCWDGEQMVYKTHDKTNNAEYLVLYHTS